MYGAQRSTPLTIELTFPLLALSAMVLGGTLGGLLLVAAAVLIMPSIVAIPAWARTTELGLFLIAAFVGFIGTPLFDRVARLLFPLLSEIEPAPAGNPQAAEG